MPKSIITLTTDFGMSDAYAASLKGAILSIDREVSVVDISHDVPRQNVPHGAFVLAGISDYFPPDTVHVAVIDPGVGTLRRPLLLVTPKGRYLAPDNGVLTYVLRDLFLDSQQKIFSDVANTVFLEPKITGLPPDCSVFELTCPDYWGSQISNTFHGRDVFAPVAAHVARGVAYEDLGEPIDRVVCLNVPSPSISDGYVKGRVIFIDCYGNLITNIREGDIPSGEVEVVISNRRIKGLSANYCEEWLVGVIGSRGYLEVAVSKGNAGTTLDVKIGSDVFVVSTA